MALLIHKNVLKGLTVQEAMRRQIIHLPAKASVEKAIRYTIKYKVNAILITTNQQEALGVVSKTDLMGAYYADLPLETPLETIMIGPPLFCRTDDSLDTALDLMRTNRVHRLYVQGDKPERAAGVLAYPDIVGLLYRYCHRCEKSLLLSRGKHKETDLHEHYQVREVMTPAVQSASETNSLMEVMECLAASRIAAVLIRDTHDLPAGVISKTDLILAYHHGLPTTAAAKTIMASPVQACDQQEILARAIKKMIFSDIHRMFVYKDHPQELVGVLSLSDAARFRSGTCRACLASRIKV